MRSSHHSVVLYLTNAVSLNPGIIGTLIIVSKLFDGISDIFFGTMIDKTKSRLGKARPWMLYAYIGCAVTLVANLQYLTVLEQQLSMHGSLLHIHFKCSILYCEQILRMHP